jgi:hypothetical protein
MKIRRTTERTGHAGDRLQMTAVTDGTRVASSSGLRTRRHKAGDGEPGRARLVGRMTHGTSETTASARRLYRRAQRMSSASRLLRALCLAVCIPFLALLAAAVPASASTQGPEILSVSFSGSTTAPTVTVEGVRLHVPGTLAAGCGASGSDFAPGALLVADTTSHLWTPGGTWFAGEVGDCVGLDLESVSATKVVFTFGNGYGEVPGYLLEPGDGFTVTMYGSSYSGVVSYPGESTIASRVLALLAPALSGTAPSIPNVATDGVYLSQVNGPVYAAANSSFPFEPASSIKVVIALLAMEDVSKGLVSLTSPIPHYVETGYPCPTSPSQIVDYTPLWNAIQLMMYDSNNWYTRDLEQYFGVAALNAFAQSLPLPNTAFATSPYPPGFNPIGIGCSPSAQPPNPTTLDGNTFSLADAGRVWQTASELPAPYSDEFFELVAGRENSNDIGADSGYWYRLETIAAQEAPATMSAAELQWFDEHMSTNSKEGDYGWSLTEAPWGRQWHVLTGISEIPSCIDHEIDESDYNWGFFIDAADEMAGGGVIEAAFNAAKDELQRDLIQSSLSDWEACAPSSPTVAVKGVRLKIRSAGASSAMFNGKVATITDSDGHAIPPSLKASISWGDGTPSQVAVVSRGAHGLSVDAWHAFAPGHATGTATITVSGTEPGDVPVTATSHWTVR